MQLTYKNISVHFESYGSGKTVVLLHGFLENSSIWQNLIPDISKVRRIITIDLLGHGETDSLGYIHTMEDMAEAVAFVLDHLNINESTIIGHSMGGYVALAYSELHPKKVNGICLVNSTSEPDSEEKKKNRDRAIKAVKQNPQAFIGMSIANLFAPENREKYAKEIQFIKQEALKTSIQGVIAALEGMKIRKSRTELFKSLPVKCSIIIGDHDPVMDYKTTAQLFENSNVETIVFSGGHMSYIENKNELSYFLMHFSDF